MSQTSIAFEIPLEQPKKKVPKRVLATLSSHRGANLSRENLTVRLGEAADRKKTMHDERVNKAKQTVERAKDTASRVKVLKASKVEEQKQKIAEKLETAEKLKETKVDIRRKQIGEHLETVAVRKEASAETPLTPGDLEIAAKLKIAEDRRKTLEGGRIEKLSAHHKTVEMRKSQEHLPGATMQQKLTSKLAAAEERRRDLGEQMNQKFAERDNRIKEVRKRKATSNAEMA